MFAVITFNEEQFLVNINFLLTWDKDEGGVKLRHTAQNNTPFHFRGLDIIEAFVLEVSQSIRLT